MSTVTIPNHQFAVLQIKASQRDELLEALEDVSDFLNFAWGDIAMNEYSFNLLEDAICKSQQAIARAKGENE